MLPNQNGWPSKATAHPSCLSRSVCRHVSAVGLQETPVSLFTWLEISHGWSRKSLVLPALPPPPRLIKYTNWPPVKHLMKSHLKQQCTDLSTKNLSIKKASTVLKPFLTSVFEREKRRHLQMSYLPLLLIAYKGVPCRVGRTCRRGVTELCLG